MMLRVLRPLAGRVDNSAMMTKLDQIAAEAAAAKQAADEAAAMAQAAETTGQSAHQMALDRDHSVSQLAGNIDSLQELATTVTGLSEASNADRAGLHAKLDALDAAVRSGTTLAVGSVSLPLIALGATYDATVPLSHTLADANYRAIPVKTGALVGGATVTVKSQTASQVVVSVKATLLIALGQTLLVIASG